MRPTSPFLFAFSLVSGCATALPGAPSNAPAPSPVAHDDIDPQALQKHTKLLDEAVTAWETDRICEPLGYWRYDPPLILESRSKEFFEQWLNRYDDGEFEESCNKYNLTAIPCFAKTYWGDFDYTCSIDQIELCSVPRPNEVVHWTQAHNKSMATAEALEQARKVWYIFKRLQHTLSDLKSDFEIIYKAGTNIASEARDMLMAFTPQADAKKLANCQMTMALIQTGIDIALQVFVIGINIQGNQLGTVLQKIQAGIDEDVARVNGAKLLKSPTVITSKGKVLQAKDFTRGLNARIATYNMLKQQPGYYNQFINAEGWNIGKPIQNVMNVNYMSKEAQGAPGRPFEQHTGVGFCSDFFDTIVDESVDQQAKLMSYINSHMDSLRFLLVMIYEQMFEYNPMNNTESVRSLILDRDWGITDSSRDYVAIEKELRLATRYTVITELQAASRQYLKCEWREDAKQVCEHHLEKENKIGRQSRYCPPDVPVRCQAASFQKKQHFDHEKPLIGLQNGKYHELGINVTRMLEVSWIRYQIGGPESFSYGSMFHYGQLAEADTRLYLPVCLSTINTVESFSNKGKKERYRLPYSCGNWASNETAAFMDRIQVNVVDEKWLRETNLPQYLGDYLPAPANRFLLLCELKVRWPRKGEHWVMEKGEDERCESVKKRIGELDELEGNREFCRMRPWIGYEDSMQIAWQFPRVFGFAHHCKKFLKDTETQEKMADRNMKGWHSSNLS